MVLLIDRFMMTSLEFETTVGKKRGSKLIYTSDHHLFNVKSKDKPSHSLYVCHIEECPAKIKIENDQCTYITSNHIHGTQEAAYEEYKINDQQIKERCLKEKKRTREIFDEECANSSLALQYAKRQRTYQLHQRKGFPKNPKSIDDEKLFRTRRDSRKIWEICHFWTELKLFTLKQFQKSNVSRIVAVPYEIV